MLASCETADEVREAAGRGYAASVVVPDFPSDRKFWLDDVAVVPCPAQTRPDVHCSSCRLCFNDRGLLERGTAIGFEVHGSMFEKKKARQALLTPDDPDRRLTSRQLIPRVLAEHPDWGPERIGREIGVNGATAGQMIRKLRDEGVIRAAA